MATSLAEDLGVVDLYSFNQSGMALT